MLYIGQTIYQTLQTRIKQYYKTCLGDPKPHAGGYWIKTLSVLDTAFVHYAEICDPKSTEELLIGKFVEGISPQTKDQFIDSGHPVPFASLEYSKGKLKQRK